MDRASLQETPLTRSSIEAFLRKHPDITVEYEPNPGRRYEVDAVAGVSARLAAAA